MPAGRNAYYRQGDHAERFAEFMLGSFAFTTAVPRPEDIGHDFHCVLAEEGPTAGYLEAGPSFSIQIRSRVEPLPFLEDHQARWALRQENPFFVGIVTRKDLRLDIYTTWNRMNALLDKGDKLPTIFEPGRTFGKPFVADGCLRVPLGPPILSMKAENAIHARAGWVADVMRPWILLDRRNIVNAEAGLYYADGFEQWEANKVPSGPIRRSFYWNSKNIQICIDNFGWTAVSLAKTIDNFHKDYNVSTFDADVPLVDAAFSAFRAKMDKSIIDLYDGRDEFGTLESGNPSKNSFDK